MINKKLFINYMWVKGLALRHRPRSYVVNPSIFNRSRVMTEGGIQVRKSNSGVPLERENQLV